MDWQLLAEPQDDGYDLECIVEAARERWPNWRPSGRPPDVHNLHAKKHWIPQAADSEAVRAVMKHLDSWPAMRRTFDEMLDVFSPSLREGWGSGVGCSCGNYQPNSENGLMCVETTVNSTIGGAEGIVHETGHLKLHALGMDLEEHDGCILANDPEELYESPIRKDKLRPMSAVVQAQYSYIHVLQLDLLCDHPDRHQCIAVYLPRMEGGHETILKSARWTEGSGEAWWAGFKDWSERVMAESREVLG